jgi:hypothetical protein
MTGRHTPTILQNLRGTPDNYLVLNNIIFNKESVSTLMVVLNNIIFNKESVSTLMVGTQQVE